MFSLAFLALSAAAMTQAAPTATATAKAFGCHLHASVAPTLPANETAVFVPPNTTLTHVLLGVGVQNYTCNADGEYTSVGAVATLYDISCLGIAAATIHQGAFFGIEDKVFNLTLPDPLASFSSANDHLIEQATGQKMHAVGHHFFVPVDGPGGNASAATLNPRFDVAEQSVVAAKSSSIPAPSGPDDVDWLQLDVISFADHRAKPSSTSNLANFVLRTDTKAGQPEASCRPGSIQTLSVNYAAKYWFYR